MDLELSHDQRAMQEMARDFARRELAPYAEAWDEGHVFPKLPGLLSDMTLNERRVDSFRDRAAVNAVFDIQVVFSSPLSADAF